MSMLVSFVLSFFPRAVLDEILNLIGSVSEGFPSYSYNVQKRQTEVMKVVSICIKGKKDGSVWKWKCAHLVFSSQDD